MIGTTLGLLVAEPAFAEDEPRFCPSRPSLASSACTTEPGRVHLEVSALDWQHDNNASEREDTVLLGDFEARIGVGPTTEAQISWTPYGHDRTRDKTGGGLQRQGGVGDVTLGIRQNLRNPDGDGLSYGFETSVTLPSGGRAIGQGDWSAGLTVPVSYDLNDLVSVTLTAEANAAADEDRHGRHFAGDLIATAELHLTKQLTLYGEGEVLRDRDPSDRSTQTYAAGGLSMKTSKTSSLWAEAVAGLNADSPDLRVFTGLTVLF